MSFVDDKKQTTDYYEGTVHSVTDNNLYYVIYSDNDSKTITQADLRNIPNQCPSRPVLTSKNIMVTITVAIARLNATILGIITLQLIMQVQYAQLLQLVDKKTHTTHPLSFLPLFTICKVTLKN
jgi:hypothetical protein